MQQGKPVLQGTCPPEDNSGFGGVLARVLIQNLYVNANGNLIHNCQKLETAQISINRETDEARVVIFNRMLPIVKVEWSINEQ